MRTLLSLATVLVLAACDQNDIVLDDDDDDNGGESDADSDTDSDTDTDTDTDSDADTGMANAGLNGTMVVTDTATFDTGYMDFAMVSLQGVDVCRIRYLMSNASPRTDCEYCDWAFTVTTSSGAFVDNTGDGCAQGGPYWYIPYASFLDGSSWTLGFASEIEYYYYGWTYHYYDQLMYYSWYGYWYNMSYAEWDPAKGGSMDFEFTVWSGTYAYYK